MLTTNWNKVEQNNIHLKRLNKKHFYNLRKVVRNLIKNLSTEFNNNYGSR